MYKYICDSWYVLYVLVDCRPTADSHCQAFCLLELFFSTLYKLKVVLANKGDVLSCYMIFMFSIQLIHYSVRENMLICYCYYYHHHG
jgi:hypothetical protein